jgi:hypothetical protein
MWHGSSLGERNSSWETTGKPVALVSFHITDWDAWAPERQTAEEWCLWARGEGCLRDSKPESSLSLSENPTKAWDRPKALPAGVAVPLLLRRRVGLLGQQALRAAWNKECSVSSRLIFASRHGEFSRTLSILDALTCDEPVSPADFTLSVHHALAGLLSIARANHQGHTAIAAGRDSFGFGLLEALACLTETPSEPVILVYYDEPLPPPFSDFDEGGDHIALALTLATTGEGSPLSMSMKPKLAGGAVSITPAQDFLRFMLSDDAHADCPGERYAWRWGRS